MKHGYGKRALACCLSVVLLFACLPFAAAAQPQTYTGTVLMALNTNRRNTFAGFSTDRGRTDDGIEAAAEPDEEVQETRLPDGPLVDPEPLSGPQALLRQAEVGDIEPQAAAEYRVGDTKQIYSHYAESEGKAYRRVDMVCTSIGRMATIWRESGTEADFTEYDNNLAADLDARLPKELEFFGDKRIDTDGDGKIAVFLYTIDGDNIGGYFTVADLMDKVGRVGSVWHMSLTSSNHMDSIHVQGDSSYSFAVETCLHEYQHYIQASYRFVGKNNFTVLKAAETYINEGFSTGAEYLLYGVDRYSAGFAYSARPSSGLSYLNWRHDNGNYNMAFVFSQYIRTRYAALTDDLDSEIPGGSVYKKILESRTPKNDDDTMALIADMLYPADVYPQLRDTEARCRQLLCDFWTAVFCQEPQGEHGFNGEEWANRIDPNVLLQRMPFGETEFPIRSGMAAFYQIATNDKDTVCVTDSDSTLQFTVLTARGYTLRFDAAGGTDAPQAQVAVQSIQIRDKPTRSGYTFLGWSTTPDAGTPQYFTGSIVRLTQDTTMYAVWQQAPTVVTDTAYPMRRQGREMQNNYIFVPETDGVYKLTYDPAYSSWMYMCSADGEWIEPSYRQGTTLYYSLAGGTAYDLYLEWGRTPPASGSGTFTLERQDEYYTLTYRFDHPLVAETWSYTGSTTYVVDVFNESVLPRFLGWAFTPDAQTPDVGEGDPLTLTQDTTLYAVCAPDTVLPTDGSEARAAMIYGAFLYVLRPEHDGMYELYWRPDGEAQAEDGAKGAALYDAAGGFLVGAEPDEALTCALRAGETYYLFGCSDTPNAAATCRKTSDRITTTLTFSVGALACFDLTLHGKPVCTVPDYTPAALDGRIFLGWMDETRWETYATGDTIVLVNDTVLTAQWSSAPQESQEYVRAVVNWVPNVVRALWQNVWLRIVDAFTR